MHACQENENCLILEQLCFIKSNASKLEKNNLKLVMLFKCPWKILECLIKNIHKFLKYI